MQASANNQGEIAIQYADPNIFEFLYSRNKEQFESPIAVKQYLVESITSQNKRILNATDTVSMEYVLDTLLKTIEFGDTILVIAKGRLNTFASDNVEKTLNLSVNDTSVGLSFNQGKNWYFIHKGKLCSELLKIRFGNDLVDKFLEE